MLRLNHRWTNRIFPPLVVVAVVGGVWYAATHRTEDTMATETNSTSVTVASAKTIKEAEPVTEPLATPLVEKLPGKVKFTVDAAKVVKVQKVEFYVSNRLVGAAYSAPYTVSVDKVTLQPGTHQVVAKVYTSNVTKDTPPADFVSSIPTGAKPSNDAIAVTPPTPPANNGGSSNNQNQGGITTPPPTPSPAPTVVSPPTGLTATAGTGSQPTVGLNWDAPADGSAASYQVWRGGVLLANGVTATSYADNSVEAAQTYYYQVVSIGSDSTTSEPSNTASATYIAPAAADPVTDN